MAKTKQKMRLVHYGASDFVPELFKPIRNRQFIKPEGGLWASPDDSGDSWRHWCEREDFRVRTLQQWFTFDFEGHILTIDSAAGLDALPWIERESFLRYPDFELIQAGGIDAIYLTSNGQVETRYSAGRDLYGWDCECVLVMNPAGISNVVGGGKSDG